MDDTIWVYNPPSEEASLLAGKLGIPLEIAQILVNRGIREPETAHNFLYGELGKLHDPT